MTLSTSAPGTLTVNWEVADPDPTDYRINWAKVGEAYPAWDASSGNAELAGPPYTVTGLEAGEEYKVRVRARYFASRRWSGPWLEATLRVASNPQPTQTPTVTSTATPTFTETATPTATTTDSQTPSGSITPSFDFVEDSIIVTWNPPASGSVDHYILTRTQDNQGILTTSTFRIDGSATRYVDSDVDLGNTYDYVLEVHFNESIAAATSTATPTLTATPTPSPAATLTATATPTATTTALSMSAPTTTPTATPTVTPAVAGIATDRAALMALFNSTDGDNWNYPQYAGGWGSTASLDQWDGVTTDASGRVTELTLSYRMHGTLPSALGNLTKLKVLSIEAFSLSGSIPTALGNLSNLEELTLHGWSLRAPDDGLSGSIPTQLGNLSKLKKLDFAHNDLSGSIPTELGNLTKLQELSLTFNDLSGSIPTQLGNLSKLTKLNLTFNDLSGSIPTQLGNLSEMQELYLSNNNLSGPIPSELGNLTKMTKLYLSNNNLSGPIPSELGNLSKIWRMYLAGPNHTLTGCIPAALYSRTLLAEMDDATDQGLWLHDFDALGLPFCGVPTATPTATETATPTATTSDSQTLTGSIIPSFDFVEDSIIVTWNPPASGSVDHYILTRTQDNQGVLTTSTFRIDGSATRYVDSDVDLGNTYDYVLEVHFNESIAAATSTATPTLTATPTPSPAATLTATATPTATTTALSMSAPTTTPTATPTVTPAVAGIATDRAALMALFNSTDGDNWNYPQYAGGWGSTASLDQWDGVTTDASGRVTELTLSYRMHGTLPSALGNLTKLKVLSIEAFSLSGSIPTALGNLSNLEELTLHGWSLRAPDDGLSGSIPTQLGNLTKLTKLDFAHNDLSGSIPTQLGNLTKLTKLDLTFNNLSGSIPTQLGNLTKLQELYLYYNNLSGPIPSELGNLTEMLQLYLSNNNLSGPIPSELGNLSTIYRMYLAGPNHTLTGCIPAALYRRTLLTDRGLRLHDFDALGLPFCGVPTATPTATPLVSPTPTVTPAVAGIATDRAALMALFNSTDGDNWNYPQYAGGWGTTASLDQWDGVTTDASGRVTELTLSYRMHGTLPSALGNLSKLKVLSIDAFSLSGSIPTELGNLSNLEELTLHGWSLRAPDDGLSGSIPTQLGNLSKLKKLDFAHNDLSGSIPTATGQPLQVDEIEPHFQQPERFDSNATGQPLQVAGIVSLLQQPERSHPI